MSCQRPPTSRTKALPYILQQLGYGSLTFFKLYAPSYRCPRCGLKGLFVKVSASDRRALTEHWDIEGPRADFKNMEGVELHQGIGAKGGFKYEEFHESSVTDHLDIFGALFTRSSRLVRALVQANLFINHQAPAQSAGDRIVEDGPGGNVSPHLANRTQRATEGERRSGDGSESGRVLSPSSSLVLKPPRPAATPQTRNEGGRTW